jgi:hypothetical protein
MSKNRCRKLRAYNWLTGSYSESEGPLWKLATLSPLAVYSRNRTSAVLELHMYDNGSVNQALAD